jgi:hypothetical protein
MHSYKEHTTISKVKTYNKFLKLLNQSITDTFHFLCIESKNQIPQPQKVESLKERLLSTTKDVNMPKKERQK